MDAKEAYKYWCESPIFSQEIKDELKKVTDEKEIEDRFYKELEFGTGGLRGVIGAGTNRMNIYTVGKATQGLANYIIKNNAQDKGVAIAYDSRHMSPEFADCAALCLAANGIKSYVFTSLRPTPELSFALRELGCTAGIVITASHNPKEYNGYKVYWEDGAQITYPRDKEIISEVNAIKDYAEIKSISKEEALAKNLYQPIDKEIDDKYIECVKSNVLNPQAIKNQADSIKIVYTPLNGTGNVLVRRVLKELGFNNVYVVPEQENPDGDFTTVGYPNPEDKNAFKLALKLAEKVGADLVLATDPDADRLGVYALDQRDGKYKSFTGNMSGTLLLEYILSEKKKRNELPDNAAVVTTIVSGKLARAITAKYNVKLIETLTGFKYIGEQIKFFEQNNSYEYEFGYEESYGCLIGTHARDKDAVAAVTGLCEAAAFYKEQGSTLCEQMDKMFEEYGYYKEQLITETLKGIDGLQQINNIMTHVRNAQIKEIGGVKVKVFKDYQEDKAVYYLENKETTTGLPQSNVLYFELENGSWCCVRPSGTEPKIKIYAGVKGATEAESEKLIEQFVKDVKGVMGI